MRKPTASRLRELLDYNPETGQLTWKVYKSATAPKGSIAGCPDGRGYRQIRVDHQNYCEHRIVWCYVYGEWPDGWLDHADGNRSNNRIANLRIASKTMNAANSAIRSDNTSGYKGVSWVKRLGRWKAQIRFEGKTKELGRFDTKEEAARAYALAAAELFGEFACSHRRAPNASSSERE